MDAEDAARRADDKNRVPACFNNDEVCVKRGFDDKKKYEVGDVRKICGFPPAPEKKAKAQQVEKFNPNKATKAELIAFLAEQEADLIGSETKKDLREFARHILSPEEPDSEDAARRAEKFNPNKATEAELIAFLTEQGAELLGDETKNDLREIADLIQEPDSEDE